MNHDEFLVSVAMITYNHESFIEEALLSIINQDTNFQYELIISDDGSKDQTRSIINSIISTSTNPNCRITFHQQSPNLGMMSNFEFVLKECAGKYIAICEGDDYWTDNSKLQQQYNLLEANSDSVLCFHNAFKLFDDSGKQTPFGTYERVEYISNDLFNSWLIPTASAFFRNVFREGVIYPDYLSAGTHGDLALFALLGEFGNYSYIDKFMSVYRINSGGVTQSGFKGIAHNAEHIAQLQRMMQQLKRVDKSLLIDRINAYFISNAFHFLVMKDRKNMRLELDKLTYPISRQNRKELYKLKLMALWKRA